MADLRERAVDTLTRAGDRAVRTGAPATAATAYGRAAEPLTRTTDGESVAAGLYERSGLGRGHCWRPSHRCRAPAVGGGGVPASRPSTRRRPRRHPDRRLVVRRGPARGGAGGRVQGADGVVDVPDADPWRPSVSSATSSWRGWFRRVRPVAGRGRQPCPDLDLPGQRPSPPRPAGWCTPTRTGSRKPLWRLGRGCAAARIADDDQAIALSRAVPFRRAPDRGSWAAAEAAAEAAAHARRTGNRLQLASVSCTRRRAAPPPETGSWPSGGTRRSLDDVAGRPTRSSPTQRCCCTPSAATGRASTSRRRWSAQWMDSEDVQDLAEADTARAAAAAEKGDHAAALEHAQHALSHVDRSGVAQRRHRVGLAARRQTLPSLSGLCERWLAWSTGSPTTRPSRPRLLHAERQRVDALLLARQGDPAAQAAFEAAIRLCVSSARRTTSPRVCWTTLSICSAAGTQRPPDRWSPKPGR